MSLDEAPKLYVTMEFEVVKTTLELADWIYVEHINLL